MGFISIILGILAIVLGLIIPAWQIYGIVAAIIGLIVGFIGIKQDSSYSKLNILGVLANLLAIGVMVGLSLLTQQQEVPPIPAPPPPAAAAIKPPEPQQKAPEPPPIIPQDGEEQDIPEGEIEEVQPLVEQREEVR